jgi:hypothetical protein
MANRRAATLGIVLTERVEQERKVRGKSSVAVGRPGIFTRDDPGPFGVLPGTSHAPSAIARVEDGVAGTVVEADVPASLVEQIRDAVARLGNIDFPLDAVLPEL